MTGRLDVTPKTTEQNRIVCTSKSEAKVTNNKKLRSSYCTIDATKLTTERKEASRGLFATAELLVLLLVTSASDLLVHTIRFCSVVFSVTSSLAVIHTIYHDCV